MHETMKRSERCRNDLIVPIRKINLYVTGLTATKHCITNHAMILMGIILDSRRDNSVRSNAASGNVK